MDTKISRILKEHVPPHAQALFARADCSIAALGPGELYKDRSSTLSRLQIDVDAWPAPPAGLFVVEERTVYLRCLDPMTVVHEYGHAIDCAFGSGIYFSGIDPTIRKAFAEARSFVTPYAATGVDEFFAECFRAWCGANSEASAWPRVSRERLRALHPTMFELLEQHFENAA
ncbi:MAG: hypothetical protein WB681_08125 [Candidatus Cybelea sp.]